MGYQQSSIDVGVGPSTSAAPATSEDATIPASPEGPQGAKVRIAALTTQGTLVVYRTGVFSPREFERGERLDLNAGPAFLLYSSGNPAVGPSDADRTLLQKQFPKIPTLAWQYAPDAWAAIYWTEWDTVPDRDALTAIAGGLKPASPKPFPVGLTAGQLPKGYQLLSASFGADLLGDGRTLSVVRLVPKLPAPTLTRPFQLEYEAGLVLSMGRTDPQPKLIERPECPDATYCSKIVLEGDTYVAAELIDVKPTMPTLQVILGLKAVDEPDMASWPPVTKIFQ